MARGSKITHTVLGAGLSCCHMSEPLQGSKQGEGPSRGSCSLAIPTAGLAAVAHREVTGWLLSLQPWTLPGRRQSVGHRSRGTANRTACAPHAGWALLLLKCSSAIISCCALLNLGRTAGPWRTSDGQADPEVSEWPEIGGSGVRRPQARVRFLLGYRPDNLPWADHLISLRPSDPL